MKFRSLVKFETIRYSKVFFFFTAVWIGLIVLFMSFFDTIKNSSSQLEELYKSFPKELLEIFGKGIDSLTSLNGFFGNSIMTYLLLSACLLVIFIGSSSIAGEITNRNILFLLSKPISRTTVFLAKLSGIFINLILSNLVLFIVTLITISIFTKENNIDWNYFLLAYLALFFLELFFFGLAQALSLKFNSGKAIALTSFLLIFSYLLNILSDLSEKAALLKYLSPIYYLDHATIAIEKSLRPESIIIILLSFLLIAISWLLFKKKDMY